PGAPASRTRASDSEREEIAQIVRDAVGEGRLDIPEGDERLAAVYAAKYRDELGPLVTDLPAGQARQRAAAGAAGAEEARGQWGPRPGHGGPGGWAPGAWGPPAYRRGFFGAHLGLVLLVSAALIGVWSLTGAAFFWPAI